MWGRANMAAVTLLLGWLCVFARAEVGNTEVTSADAEAETILERAATWLWSQRDKDAGWGNDTHRVLLVLRLANLSRDDNVAPPAPLELQLTAKQMELEIVLSLWRHREVGFSPVRLARYTLALNAMCMDPRQFHGHDLIGTLQHHEPPTDYEFALTTLAACSAQAHVRKRQIRRLLDIANAARDHNVDTVAMVILALQCIVQDHRHRNLHHFVRKPSMGLAQQQRLDGSFGDLHTTALVMQALEEVENEPADNWNRSAALAWLISQQRTDGSFRGDVRVTAEAMLGVAPRGLASIRALDCGQGLSDNSPPRLTTSNIADVSTSDNHSETAIPSASAGNVSNVDTTIAGTAPPVLVNVSYTLWVGSNLNETYNLTVTAPKNETFYGVMLLAAEMSPHFQFTASEWPNGHYVHTLAGYKEEPMSYHYWLLYRLPSPPEPSSPPGNQLVAPGGVDDLQISEGEHYLFWYKKL
ncbi:uncharacterized protein CG3556 isoform X1 [Harpegnathos saltator]|uniref:uncharacterized protein CG3556 isoform X1 n=1 Tax=Harpegnathos saltator TaxID=610380 RepID=UPI00058D6C19|nr:uncharacterized protein CG3556 isoform X1 [Harpegnathos saltator]XP_025162245.1 uncharacterized protein CG3556 isoform X1 [Harpegnathos saltator]